MACFREDATRACRTTPDEEVTLGRRISAAGSDDDRRMAAAELAGRNLKLALWFVGTPWAKRTGLSPEDRLHAATLGLVRAARKFDPSMGRYSQYATRWMRAGLQDEFEAQAFVPIPLRYRRRAIRSDDPIDVVEAVRRRKGASVLGLEFASGLTCPSTSSDVDDADQRDWRRREMRRRLRRLDPESRSIVRMRYGLGGREPMTYSAIGASLGVSRITAAARLRDAVRKLGAEEP